MSATRPSLAPQQKTAAAIATARSSTRRRVGRGAKVHLTEAVLFEAAALVIRTRGYAGATLRMIADEAGMLPGSVHYRFRTKEDLLVALMEHAVERTLGLVRAAADAAKTPEERFRAAGRAHFDAVLTDEAYVLLFEWNALPPQRRASVVRLRDRYDAYWDGLIHEAAGAGRFAPGLDLKLLRLFGLGAANWAAQWYRPGAGPSPAELSDVLWTMLAHGILVDEHHGATPIAGKPRGRIKGGR